jgi:hypothetical protein
MFAFDVRDSVVDDYVPLLIGNVAVTLERVRVDRRAGEDVCANFGIIVFAFVRPLRRCADVLTYDVSALIFTRAADERLVPFDLRRKAYRWRGLSLQDAGGGVSTTPYSARRRCCARSRRTRSRCSSRTRATWPETIFRSQSASRKDGPDLDGKLPIAVPAAPNVPVLNRRYVRRAAPLMRTGHAVREPHPDEKAMRDLRVRELGDGFNEGLGGGRPVHAPRLTNGCATW